LAIKFFSFFLHGPGRNLHITSAAKQKKIVFVRATNSIFYTFEPQTGKAAIIQVREETKNKAAIDVLKSF